MADAAGRPWLIAINGNPGAGALKQLPGLAAWLMRVLWDWAIAPLFGRPAPAAIEGLVDVSP
jgi:hypothetical protein